MSKKDDFIKEVKRLIEEWDKDSESNSTRCVIDIKHEMKELEEYSQFTDLYELPSETRSERKIVNRKIFSLSNEDLICLLEDVLDKNVNIDFLVTLVMAANGSLGSDSIYRNKFCEAIKERVSDELKDLPQTLGTFRLIPLKPIGDFIIDSEFKGIALPDGQYYHYADVCTLLRRMKDGKLK
jgi:hypothetical protein